MKPMFVSIPYRGKVYAFWRDCGQVYVNASPAHRQGRCCGDFLKYNGTSAHHFRHVCLSWLRGHYKLKGFRE